MGRCTKRAWGIDTRLIFLCIAFHYIKTWSPYIAREVKCSQNNKRHRRNITRELQPLVMNCRYQALKQHPPFCIKCTTGHKVLCALTFIDSDYYQGIHAGNRLQHQPQGAICTRNTFPPAQLASLDRSTAAQHMHVIPIRHATKVLGIWNSLPFPLTSIKSPNITYILEFKRCQM